jgi:hypothetical protein
MLDNRKHPQNVYVIGYDDLLARGFLDDLGGQRLTNGIHEFEFQLLGIINTIQVGQHFSPAKEIPDITKIRVALDVLEKQDRSLLKGLLDARNLIDRVHLFLHTNHMASAI